MARVTTFFWRILSIFTVCIFVWLSIAIGFTNLLKFPYYIYVSRWQDFQSEDILINYWGVKSFESDLWKNGVDRAPQAIYLAIGKKLIGLNREAIEQFLGLSDGGYVLSDANLTYSIVDHMFKRNEKSEGAKWNLVVFMSEGKAREIKFYKSCCR